MSFFTDVFLSHQINGPLCSQAHILTWLGLQVYRHWSKFTDVIFTDVFLSHQINGLLCSQAHIFTLLGRATFQIESSVISLQNSHTSSEALLPVRTVPTECAALLTYDRTTCKDHKTLWLLKVNDVFILSWWWFVK